MIGLYLEDYGLMAIIILFYLQKIFIFIFYSIHMCTILF